MEYTFLIRTSFIINHTLQPFVKGSFDQIFMVFYLLQVYCGLHQFGKLLKVLYKILRNGKIDPFSNKILISDSKAIPNIEKLISAISFYMVIF